MKKLGGFIILLILIGAAMIFASPYYTLYQLKNAYENQDSNTINAHIDFEKLRQNLKAQLTPNLTAKAENLTQSPILQAMNINIDGAGIVEKMVNQAVDNTVTPTGVNNVLSGQASVKNLDNNAKLLGGLVAVAMDKINIQELITARNQEELTQKVKQQLQAPNPNPVTNETKANYCGFNCFEVNTQVRGYLLTVEMARQGLIHWKIVGVKLPL